MKTVRFTSGPNGYTCNEPNDNSGEYVKADVAAALLKSCGELEVILAFHSSDPTDEQAGLIAQAKADARSAINAAQR